MIVNFKDINLLKILISIYNNKLYSVVIKYWKIFYFLVYWFKILLFPYNYKVLYKKYQTKYRLMYIIWKYLNRYLKNENKIKNKNINTYVDTFIIKQFLNKKNNINWNNLKLNKSLSYFLDLYIYFDKLTNFNLTYNYSYNLYSLKYLNICY